MKSNLKIFMPVVLAILFGSLTFIFAQTKDGSGGNFPRGDKKNFGGRADGFGRGGLNPRMLEQLNLSDAQKEQIRTLMETARTESQTYFEKIRTFDDRLRTSVEGGTFNEMQAREILAIKTQAHIELEVIRLKTDAAIYNLLTDEQRTRLAQLKQQRPDSPRGDRPGMPPPPQL